MSRAAAAEAEIQRLEGLGAGDAAGPGFAALAEAQRRAGRPEEALRIAQDGLRVQPDLVAGRVALGLALLDLERAGEARAEFERALDVVPAHPLALEGLAAAGEAGAARQPFDDLAESELEGAFEEAEAHPEEMLDANALAEAALRDVDGPAATEGDLEVTAGSPFATETMAGLLEDQGFSGEARAVRDTLSQRGAEAKLEPDIARVVETLERWLVNLRKGSQ